MAEKRYLVDFEKTLSALLIRTNTNLSKENAKMLLDFQKDLTLQSITTVRIIKYLQGLYTLSNENQIEFNQATKDQIEDVAFSIMRSKKYKNWTKKDFIQTLKRFFKWLRHKKGYPTDYADKTLAGIKIEADEYPIEVKSLKAPTASKCRETPSREDLLTEDDVKKLIDATKHPRDKALISTIYESASRIGEIGTIRIRDVKFDEYGAILNLIGKTGQRPVRIVASTQSLRIWLENHPARKNRDAPVWVNIGNHNNGKPMRYTGIRKVIQTLLHESGIKKDAHPHLFRRSRLTHLADQGMTEYQMNAYAGWVHGSNVASTYIKLSGRDTDDAILRINGISKGKEASKPKFIPQECPRCKELNSPDAENCSRCWIPLGVNAITRIDEQLNKLTEYPDVLNRLVDEMLSKKLTEIDKQMIVEIKRVAKKKSA